MYVLKIDIAIYGVDFSTAGDRVDSLFNGRGFWNTILNDLVISRVLVLSVFGVACYTSVFGIVLGNVFFYGRYYFKFNYINCQH